MNEASENFVHTLEHRRFVEFCDACRQYRYIGLCYGPPGVGKTLSARRYADWDRMESDVPCREAPDDFLRQAKAWNTLFFTPDIINSPSHIQNGIEKLRRRLHALIREPLRREEDERLAQVLKEEKEHQEALLDQESPEQDWYFGPALPPLKPSFADVVLEFEAKRKAIKDPTSLILIDEADRLRLASLEQTRDIFDQGDIGLILIGMPGIEKRLARYPQFYSRIGFVHEFRPLNVAEVQRLLRENWRPSGVSLPPLDEQAITALIRVTGGNFRLLHRVLAQAERIARINELSIVTGQVIDAARESLVIGQL